MNIEMTSYWQFFVYYAMKKKDAGNCYITDSYLHLFIFVPFSTCRCCFRILLQIPHIIHDIPRTIYIEASKMITIIPSFHFFCLSGHICVGQNLIYFFLCKSKIFIESGIRNIIRHKIIRSCEDTFFCNLQTTCYHRKPKCRIIFQCRTHSMQGLSYLNLSRTSTF